MAGFGQRGVSTERVETRHVPGGIRLMRSVSIQSASLRACESVPEKERVVDCLPAHLLLSGFLATLVSRLAVVVGSTGDGTLLPPPAAPPGRLT